MSVPLVIAIDGPVASGKTTVGEALAAHLGYQLIDTGLMYRALTWAVLNRHVSLGNESEVSRLVDECDILMEQVSAKSGLRITRVVVEGIDVTNRLAERPVEEAVSLVSAMPVVRQALVAKQRLLAANGHVVMVGRDIGTVVLPNAPAKIFLEASQEERVRRRFQERKEKGLHSSLEEVRLSLERRDSMDSQRLDSPLQVAEDAIRVFTDGLTIQGVVERVLELTERGDS